MTREIARPFPWRCPKCLKREVQPTIIADYQARVKHDGRVHEVVVRDLKIAQCQACGETIFTFETDEQINAALRDKLELLQPHQIRELRGTRTQQELARLIGTAEETICRWETGAVIQSRAMDKLLRVSVVSEAAAILGQPLPNLDWTEFWMCLDPTSCGTGFFNWTESASWTPIEVPDPIAEVPGQNTPPPESNYRIAA